MEPAQVRWHPNKEARRLVVLSDLVLLAVWGLGAFLLAPSLGVPGWGYVGSFVILAFPVGMLERLAPSRIGLTNNTVSLNWFFHLFTKRFSTAEVVSVRYGIEAKQAAKSAASRPYKIEIRLRTGKLVRFFCDGPVASALMDVLPKDKSRLVLGVGYKTIEERPLI
jgi:hypothetical protein